MRCFLGRTNMTSMLMLLEAHLVGKIGGNIWLIFQMAGLPKYHTTEY
jgi:hypothetical protein